MATPLDKWQERMERHFSVLAEQRLAMGLPLFALEHGFSDAELDEISGQLRLYLKNGKKLASHWLLWTIYAAEQGYTYEGDEYWQSFEEITPGWDSTDRYRVSAWFSKFQRIYHGVVPSGPWAEHFSIIAWPITHAVLPRYLQQQFARALYDLRFMLLRLDSIEPVVIGRMIATNVSHVTTRFEQFLQQEELVGRIVLSILHRDPHQGEEPLLPTTLARIVGDLEQARNARSWLRETSRIVTDRFKARSRGGGPRQARVTQNFSQTSHQESRPDIRPNLHLRYDGSDQWSLVIELPSFKAVAAMNVEVRQYLKQTRCALNGDSGKKPAGWILSGNRRAVLKCWPDPKKPLVEFEQPNGTVDHILESECRMRSGPIWLFRIGQDGNAQEIVRRTIRPSNDYILVSQKPFEELLEGMKPCKIDCIECEAIRVSIPTEVPSELSQWLSLRKLDVTRTIHIWPAGLPGRNWDSEGSSEWLSTERPCFGVMPDHPIDSFLVSLNKNSSTIIKVPTATKPTYFQLPQLEPGTHSLTIRAKPKRSSPYDGSETPPGLEGFLQLRVREPEPWIPGTVSHSGIYVTNNPHDATLDVFWENEIDLTVFGPKGRQVTPHVCLENAKGEEIYSAQVCQSLDLPITPQHWRKWFSQFMQRERCEWRYLEATSGLLKIDGGELGLYNLRFDHEVLPVRWVIRHLGKHLSVRLVDDTAQQDIQPRCRFYSMETPTSVQRLNIKQVTAGIKVDAPGGLYIGQVGKYYDSVVVSAGLAGKGLKGIGVKPSFGHISHDPNSTIRLLKILRLWKDARFTGFLSSARQRQVVNGLQNAIYGVLAGWDWARSERSFLEGIQSEAEFDRLQAAMGHPTRFAGSLRVASVGIERDPKSIYRWFAAVARRYRVCNEDALPAFAVDVAFNLPQTPQKYRDKLPTLLGRLMKNPLLLRGARFVALVAVSTVGQDTGKSGR